MNNLNSQIMLRDQIAMMVILGAVSRENQTGNNAPFLASYAYQIADAMLKEREKRLPKSNE